MIVPDYQLSLAIGKEGQNARLAARLTGWRIDIRSDAAAPDAAAPDTAAPDSAAPDIQDGAGLGGHGPGRRRLGAKGTTNAGLACCRRRADTVDLSAEWPC